MATRGSTDGALTPWAPLAVAAAVGVAAGAVAMRLLASAPAAAGPQSAKGRVSAPGTGAGQAQGGRPSSDTAAATTRAPPQRVASALSRVASSSDVPTQCAAPCCAHRRLFSTVHQSFADKDTQEMGVEDLLRYNKQWADEIRSVIPDFFSELAKQQTPQFLWIGCSDSRVPANQIVGLQPGEVFVHRNIANVVVPSDLNCLSVLQFAVEHLKVRHVIVCGHYGCGGVKAALTDTRLGLADNWTRHVRDIHRRHTRRIAKCGSEDAQLDLLCELNVVQQLHNVAETTVIRDAWAAGSEIKLHGLIYRLSTGLITPLVELNHGSEPYALEHVARRIIRAAHERAGVPADNSDEN